MPLFRSTKSKAGVLKLFESFATRPRWRHYRLLPSFPSRVFSFTRSLFSSLSIPRLVSFRSTLAEIATGTDCNISGWIDNVTRVFPPLESWTHLVQESSGELGLSAKLAWVLGKRIRYKWFLTGEGIGH